MRNRKHFIVFILLFAFCLVYSSKVSAASIYDNFDCVDGALINKTTGRREGSCVIKNDTIESCPTRSLRDKYDISKIFANIDYEYNAAIDKFTMIVKNLKGLYIRFGYGQSVAPTSDKFYPDASGTVRANGFNRDLLVTIYVYIDGSNKECVDTLYGKLNATTPIYRVNTLYEDALCVNYRNKFSSQKDLAQRFVPECYQKNLQIQYDRNTVKNKIDEATAIITNLANFDDGNAFINLACDFYDQNNHGSSTSGYVLSQANSSWDVLCFESLSISFDTPKALYAGDSFSYWVNLTIEKTCYPKWNGTFPSDPGSGGTTTCEEIPEEEGDKVVGATYPASCRFKTVCFGVDDKEYAEHAGPKESFDSCVLACDNGKYTQKCIDSCYDLNYSNKSNSTKGNQLYNSSATKLIRDLYSVEKMANSSSQIPVSKYYIGDKAFFTTGITASGWDGLNCIERETIEAGCYKCNFNPNAPAELKGSCAKGGSGNWKKGKVSDSYCAGVSTYINSPDHPADATYGWMQLTKWCKGPNSHKYIEINKGCSEKTCSEILVDEGCLEGTGILEGETTNGTKKKKVCHTSGCDSCDGRGDRIMNELERLLNDVYRRLDAGEFVDYDDSHTEFRGEIIDSYTKKSTVYTDNNGNPLIFTDSAVSNGYKVKRSETIRYEWECEECVTCPSDDDDDGGGGGGSSGGGGGGGGGGSCGPGCASDYTKDLPAKQLSSKKTGVIRTSECENDCECSEWEDYSRSKTFEIRSYSTTTKYRINLGNAYKSAVDGSTVYGDTIYSKLDSSIKQQYYYGGKKYYSNVYSPMINDWRKWPTYQENQNKNCLSNGTCITKNDKSLTKNILEYLHLGSWGQWEINLECFYGIINNFCVNCDNIGPSKPMGCNPKTDICDSGLNYIFRRIDLDNKNMFPDRNPRWNWTGTITTDPINGIKASGSAVYDTNYMIDPEKLINNLQSKGTSIYSSSNASTGNDNNPELDYEVVLSKGNIRTIKKEADDNYSNWQTCTNGVCVKNNFDMTCTTGKGGRTICTSKFLTNTRYLTLVKRPTENGCNNLRNGRCTNN